VARATMPLLRRARLPVEVSCSSVSCATCGETLNSRQAVTNLVVSKFLSAPTILGFVSGNLPHSPSAAAIPAVPAARVSHASTASLQRFQAERHHGAGKAVERRLFARLGVYARSMSAHAAGGP